MQRTLKTCETKRRIKSTSPCRPYSCTSKKRTAHLCLISFRKRKTKPRRQYKTLAIQSRAFFFVVDDLVKLAALSATTISSMQQVNIGYVILHKTGKFSQPIVEGNRKPFLIRRGPTSRHTFAQPTRSYVQPPTYRPRTLVCTMPI